jgi:hypothetical protein
MKKLLLFLIMCSTTLVSAQNNTSLNFTSSSSPYVYLPTSVGWNNLSGLSFGVWFKFSNNGTYMVDLSDGTCDNCWAHRYGFGASLDSSTFGFGVEGSSSVTMNRLEVSQTQLDTGWNNAVITMSTSQSIGKLYLNGVLVDSSSISSSGGALTLGTGNNNSKILGKRSSLTPSSRHYSGYLDQFSIWDKALSQSEVSYYYQFACLDGTESGLLYAWDFDEGTGSSSYDVKNSTIATLVNSPLWANTKPNVQCCSDSILIQAQSGIFTTVPGIAHFTSAHSDTSATYQWQQNNGTGWTNLNDIGIYSGTTTDSLVLTGITTSLNGYGYRCIIDACTMDTTDVAFLTVVDNVGIEESAAALTISPNPTSGLIYVDIKANYSVYNMTGQKVAEGKTEGQIDLSNLPTGSFQLILSTEEGTTTHTIQKI